MFSMTKPKNQTPTQTLYLRKFPRDVSREIKSRAALAGLTISEYLAQFFAQSFRPPK